MTARLICAAAAVLWLTLAPGRAPAASGAEGAADPFSLPLQAPDPAEELQFFKAEGDVVTSVSREEEPLWDAAAAVYVISGADIEASGAEDLTDALRMVPGLDVAAIDFNQASLSSRGFTGMFADKMLVLLDGHPIYTPLFGGTVWPQWSTFLADVDRIEVIRGPGGTLWGSNAVNGVINIITKNAEDTQGTLLRAHAGSNSSFRTEARHGGGSGFLRYRIYGRWDSSQGFGGDGGDDIRDQRDEDRLGYRLDWDLGRGLRLSSLGEYYDGRLGNDARGDAWASTGENTKYTTELFSTIWRLEKDFADGSQGFLRGGADYVDRRVPFLGDFANRRRSWNIELEHRFRLERHSTVSWGLDFRSSEFDIRDGLVGFACGDEILNVAGAFVQARVSMGPELVLTLGSRAENNSFTGTDFQPSARLAYRIDGRRSAWAAVSRAVNTPALSDMFADLSAPVVYDGRPAIARFMGDGRAGDGKLLAYEIGYRRRFGEDVSVDTTAFYNEYDSVAGWNGRQDPEIATLADGTPVLLHVHDNLGDAFAYGSELMLRFAVSDTWRGEINASYLEFHSNLRDNPDVPHWKVNIRHYLRITPKLSLVPTLHWVDAVTSDPVFRSDAVAQRRLRIASYLRTDLALNFEPGGVWPSISLVGQNLTERSHLETYEELVREPSAVSRSWFLRLAKEL